MLSERNLAVTIQRLSLIVLAVVTSLAWTGCQPAAPTPVENYEARPLAKKRGSPGGVNSMKADENLARSRLLLAEAVQKDLGLTPDQMGKIRDFVKANRERSREWVARWPDLSSSPGDIRKCPRRGGGSSRCTVRDLQREQKESRARVVGMLTPSQTERLKQIQLQRAIAAALAGPDLVKALAISEEQLAKIRPLSDRIAEKRLAELHGLDGLNPKERRNRLIELSKKFDKAQAEANRLAIGALTPEQRAKLDKFVGKEIGVTWDYDVLVPDDGVF